MVELRLVGVYLDRADVYSDVGKACPDAARRMVAFAKRLAVHARGHNPDIFVLLQNAKVLFGHRDMIEAIETIAKEDLFYGINHDKVPNPPGMVRDKLTNLAFAARSGLKVFVVEYLSSAAASGRVGERISVLGYLPLITERGLGTFDHTPQDVPANPSAVPSPTPKPHPSDARGPRGWQRPLA